MPVVPWVKKQRLFDARVLAAHCVHIDEGEMRALKEAGAGVAHNPTSNLKLGSGIAPVAQDARARRRRSASAPTARRRTTTSTCSRRCGWRRCWRRGSSGDPTALPAREALAMATRIGARAIHLGAITGSLEPGKRADLIVVDLDQTHNVPRFDRDSERRLLAARLCRQSDRRRRRDVRRPMADARPSAADDRRRRGLRPRRATSRGASTRS